MAGTPLGPLPADAVLVHVGMFKTGTTALQNRLARARPQLAERQVTYPGTREAHHVPAQALRGLRGVNGAERSPALWDALAEEVRATPGRVVVSSEYIAQSDDQLRAKLVADLGGDRVHIVIGVRNPASHVLSSWQQILKDRKTTKLTKWLERSFRRDPYSDATPTYWKYWDPVRIVRNWVDAVGADRVTVVALDEGDRGLLGRTFEQLLDLPEDLLNAIPVTKSNRSLTLPEAECVRQINLAVRDTLSAAEYSDLVRYGLISRLTDDRRPMPGERRAVLPRWAFEQAGVEAERIRAAIAGTGVTVAGDLASLIPPENTVGPFAEADEPELLAADLSAQAALGVIETAVAARRAVSPAEPLSIRSLPSRELTTELQRRLRRRVRRGLGRVRRPH